MVKLFPMVAILYGSSTGQTEEIADALQKVIPDSQVFNICDFDFETLAQVDYLILGTSTWGAGELQSDWVDRIDELAAEDLSQKTVAFFGLGDQKSFAETFLGGLAILHKKIAPLAQKVIGRFSDPEMVFEHCEAFVNGAFVGLAIDEDNQSSKSDKRIKRWSDQLKEEMKAL